jgi:hypothetical protein
MPIDDKPLRVVTVPPTLPPRYEITTAVGEQTVPTEVVAQAGIDAVPIDIAFAGAAGIANGIPRTMPSAGG